MPAYRIRIDRSLCSGFGICEAVAPGAFELDGDGVVAQLAGVTDDPAVLEAPSSCPAGAITVLAIEQEAA